MIDKTNGIRGWGAAWVVLLALLLATPARAQVMKMRVTFYAPGGRSHTATGRSPRLPGVAVDPHVIPLGSRVLVPGFGVRVADDTGGAIKGHRLDVRLTDGGRALARKHGVKHLKVRVIGATAARHRRAKKAENLRRARLAHIQAARAAERKKAREVRQKAQDRKKRLVLARERRERQDKRERQERVRQARTEREHRAAARKRAARRHR